MLMIGITMRTLIAGGTFKQIHPHELQTLQVLEGPIGAEDLTIDHSIGKALLSADDRRKRMQGEKTEGAIYLLDYQKVPPNFYNLTENLNLEDFHPHGISLFHDTLDNSKWLFVVNHSQSEDWIEIFKFTDTSLIHIESLTDKALVSPNDIVGTGKRTFYFTNDHDAPGGTDRWKDYLLIGTGQVGFYDGKKATILDTGIGYANGINLTQDGSHLIVAATTDRCLYLYQREPHQRIGKIDCRTGPDNIELDASGNLWVGAHPKMLAFARHAKNEKTRSPSQILMIELNPDHFKDSKVRQIYLNNGDPLSGSSVAAIDGDILLVGTVFENGIGISRINE